MDKFCLYILIKCIFKSVDIIFKLFVKYLNYFEVSKKIEVFLDLFFSPFIFLPPGKSPQLWRYVTHLSIVVFRWRCCSPGVVSHREELIQYLTPIRYGLGIAFIPPGWVRLARPLTQWPHTKPSPTNKNLRSYF
jgi:hypothetical protein